MGHDYRGFQDKIGADMATASAAAAGMDRGAKGSKMRIRASDMESLVPSGSLIEFVPTTGHKLKFGDIVMVRSGTEFCLRRFVSFQIVKGGAMVSVARISPPKLETYPDTSLVGRVTKAESKGVSFDPLKKESQLVKWRNEWTFFGTSSMFSRIGQNLKIFGKMMKKQ